MSSKREQILSALFTKLQTLGTTHIKVYRNQDKPQKVDGGLIIMRDGASEQPDILLSPVIYIFEHAIPLEVMVQNANPALRDSQLDALLVSIGGILNANPSLGGLVEWLQADAPAFIDEPIDGGASVKMAQLNVVVRFSTSDPLN